MKKHDDERKENEIRKDSLGLDGSVLEANFTEEEKEGEKEKERANTNPNTPIFYLPLKYDKVFKGFFSKEDNKHLLMELLKQYLDLEIENPDDIDFLNTELSPNAENEKQPRLDLLVKCKNYGTINIEIQTGSRQDAFLKRIHYYNSKVYVRQLKAGSSYEELKKTISLIFLDFNIFDGASYKNNLRIINEATGKVAIEDYHVCILEMKKYLKSKDKGEVDKDNWLDLFSASAKEEYDEIKERGATMAEAIKKLELFSQEEKDSYWPEMFAKAEHDRITLIEASEKRGEKRGERCARMKTAKNMLKLGLEIDIIAKSTGLSKEEIKSTK